MSTAKTDRLADAEFAFPKSAKNPLSEAAHVRNAIARFDQVEGITDVERDQACQGIRAAAGPWQITPPGLPLRVLGGYAAADVPVPEGSMPAE
jgi:hypothetical protein